MNYPPEEIARMGAQGLAFKLPDGTWAYPIANEVDLIYAIEEVGHAGVDFDPVRRYIMGRARDLGLAHRIPVTWLPDGAIANTGGTTDGRSMHPRESLVRGWLGDGAISLRDSHGEPAADGNTLIGHFAVWNRWTEINSRLEGHFMERVAPEAFHDAFARRERIKVLFNHGKDPSTGNKPLGPLRTFEDRDGGAYYEVDLLDAPYVNELKPAMRAGLLGSSFRFGIADGGDDWNDRPARSEHNPQGLPECTLRGIEVYEGGPVTFPAYEDAGAGLRSLTDDFVERMLSDPIFLARLVERAGLKNVEPILEASRDAIGEAEEQAEELLEELAPAQEAQEGESGGAADDELDAQLRSRREFLARLV